MPLAGSDNIGNVTGFAETDFEKYILLLSAGCVTLALWSSDQIITHIPKNVAILFKARQGEHNWQYVILIARTKLHATTPILI